MPLKVGSSLPRLSGATDWLNVTDKVSGPDFTLQQPMLVHFWAKSCPACKINMPAVRKIADTYRAHGLQVIAVHMPRGPYDLDIETVLPTVRELGITEPCAIDNEHEVGDLFEVKAWPAYYLFNAGGTLKRHAAGGFGVRMIELALKDIFDPGLSASESLA